MIRNLGILIILLGLASCGERKLNEKDAPEEAFVGSWQSIFDQSGFSTCDPNLDCKCADVINFYDHKTFDRNLKCDYKKGYYELKGDRVQLTYISEYPQLFTYTIGKNELFLVKDDTVYKYIRKPFKVKMEEAGKPTVPIPAPTSDPTPKPTVLPTPSL